MPANLKDLRSRIKSVKSTQQITKAMKLVSAAKFGRAQSNVINSRPYASMLSQLTAKLAGLLEGGCMHPLVNESKSNKAVVLVISSERGLCAGYNAYVTKQAHKAVKELEADGKEVSLICIGKKSFQSLLRFKTLFLKEAVQPAYGTVQEFLKDPETLLPASGLALISTSFDKPSHSMASHLAEAFVHLYKESKIGKLVVVYNKFQSAMTQIPTTEVVLPLHVSGPERSPEPIFEPEVEDLLDEVIPRYMASKLFQTLLESVASEHGARMTAMDNATRNAQEMQKKLQITYQRARQAAITKELIEIISGAEAL